MPEINTIAALLADGNLQGYWRLENANDTGPNSYNLGGTAPSYAAAKFFNGGDFEDTSSQYLFIANASCPNLKITGSHSVSAWVKLESNAVGARGVAAMRDYALGAGWAVQINTSNAIFFIKDGLTTNTAIAADVAATVGTFCHIVGVYDSATSKLKIFMNGVKKEVTASGSSTSPTVPFMIGGYPSGAGPHASGYIDGIIDDVAVFDRALTDAEVASIFSEGVGGMMLAMAGAL